MKFDRFHSNRTQIYWCCKAHWKAKPFAAQAALVALLFLGSTAND